MPLHGCLEEHPYPDALSVGVCHLEREVLKDQARYAMAGWALNIPCQTEGDRRTNGPSL